MNLTRATVDLDNLVQEFDRLQQTLEAIRSADISEACEAYRSLKDFNDKYSETGKVLTAVIEELKHTVIPAKFESKGVSSFTTTSGYRIGVSVLTRASMTDKEAGKAWLKDNGLADLVTETVNSSTLAAAAKTLLEEGRELPTEFFKTTLMPTTSVTKVK